MKPAILITTLCLIALNASANGIENSTPNQRASIQTQFMISKLGLNADQSAKITSLNLKYAELMEPIHKGSDGFLAKRQKGKAIMDSKDSELKSILSPEQINRYNDLKDDLKEEVNNKLNN